MQAEQIQSYLEQTVDLAQSRLGTTNPNPAVAALIVNGGKVIATGVHQAAGLPHAEVLALQNLSKQDLSLAMLFVSLEPCCHHGRTPPCTDAIIASGIKQVYYAHHDQNPEVAGNSRAILRDAGVEAHYVALDSAKHLYRYYDFWRALQKPWLTAKLAVSRDGCYRSLSGKPLAITGDACNRLTHQQRQQHDAIISTYSTILNDDPRLSVRIDRATRKKPVVVLDRLLRISSNAQLLETAEPLIVVHDKFTDTQQVTARFNGHVELLALDFSSMQTMWQQLLSELALRGYHSIWVEAGAILFRWLWQQCLLQDAYLYVGNTVVGNRQCSAQMAPLLSDEQWASMHWSQFDDDWVGYMDWSRG